ncbi:MAG: TRAP transporter substrate-binding protein [Lachnospiraceae bacterium]|nr:TRAP transporter substrate-binding protein [Candidatus Minthocola equi]
MKKVLALLLALIMGMSLVACGGSDNPTTAAPTTAAPTTAADVTTEANKGLEGTYEFIVGSSSGKGITCTTVFEKVQEEIEKLSDGKMKITYYGASALGSDSEMLQEVVAGNLSMEILTTASLTSTVPEMALFDMQCAIKNKETYAKLFSDPDFLAKAQEWFAKANLRLVAWAPNASKIMASSKPLNTMDDFKGFNMRTLKNKYHIDFWRQVGCNTLQVDASEYYLAFQQGLIDGAELSISGIISRKLNEVAPIIINTGALSQANVVVMSLDQYNKMTDNDKAWFDNYMMTVSEAYIEQTTIDEDEGWKSLEAAGATCVRDFSSFYEGLRAAAEETTYKTIREDLGNETVDFFLGCIAKYE